VADPYATVTPERQRRVDRARELRGQGYLQREIADLMGISRSAANDLLTDPDNAKKRSRRLLYGGTCRICGKITDGSAGNHPPPDICIECGPNEQHENRRWTPEAVIAALQEFRQRVGRTPTATDLLVRAGAPSIERTLSTKRLAEIAALPRDLVTPPLPLVQREFGSWRAALEAAGLPPNPTGGAAHRNKERKVMPRRYVVFSKNGHGWVPHDAVEAHDPDDAIQRVAELGDREP
jgi:transcriptional regulator with XRE-family HTH domain